MKRPAIFLDRDGTLIEDAGYIGDPDQVRLFPDSAQALQRFHDGGFAVVLVSNQSGIARGRFSGPDLERVHARMESLLAQEGARLDAHYYCPYLDGPEAVVETYRRDSNLRKPKPGMLLQAAKELNIDLSRSWMVGDAPTDVQAGRTAGCRTILIGRNDRTAPADLDPSVPVAADLLEAARIVEQSTEGTPEPWTGMSHEPHDDRVAALLERIHDQLERAYRRERQHDFSFLRLFGALLQMLAIVAGLWGLAGLLDDHPDHAAARLALAAFLQLGSLTSFVIDRFR